MLTVGALSWSVGSWIQGRIGSPRSAATLPGPGWPASRSVRRAWRRRWCPDCRCCRPC
ncbi:hypothetical protein V2I01_13710 [Micromonospora sp. BRA006-A]|nr:hypothetical protein [Micromonospora sp. BRA006-A]